MGKNKIEDYELPTSLHGTKGMVINLCLFAIVGISILLSVSTLWLNIGILVLFFGNFSYWFNKDHERYSKYKTDYISVLDHLDVEQIEDELKVVEFGSATERFITSYLRKKRDWTTPSCNYEKPEFKCP